MLAIGVVSQVQSTFPRVHSPVFALTLLPVPSTSTCQTSVAGPRAIQTGQTSVAGPCAIIKTKISDATTSVAASFCYYLFVHRQLWPPVCVAGLILTGLASFVHRQLWPPVSV